LVDVIWGQQCDKWEAKGGKGFKYRKIIGEWKIKAKNCVGEMNVKGRMRKEYGYLSHI
jgi:hypothetical protein